MAEVDPPEPPPLLRELPHRFPTPEERAEARRRVQELQEESFWNRWWVAGLDRGCGCLLLAGLSVAAAIAVSGTDAAGLGHEAVALLALVRL